MMYSAFQPSSYQNNAYQVFTGVGTPIQIAPSYDGRHHYWDRVMEALDQQDHIKRLNDLEQQRLYAEKELALKDQEIDRLEERRLKSLADQLLQAELMALLIEAKRLEDERIYLDGFIKWLRMQEDDVMVILMCLPFVN